MNKEEIKHFKAMLKQGSLRHMNILLDDKFQKELLNIIKDYDKLQQENNQLKEKVIHKHKYASEMEGNYILEKYKLDELRSWLEEEKNRLARECSQIYEDSLGKTRLVNEDIFNEVNKILSKLNELEGGKNE